MSKIHLTKRMLAAMLVLVMAVSPVTEVRAAEKVSVTKLSGDYDGISLGSISEGLILVSKDG